MMLRTAYDAFYNSRITPNWREFLALLMTAGSDISTGSAVSIASRGAVNWRQAIAGSDGSQGFPAMAALMASSAVMPWAAAVSR
jgi:hypothetical protein